MRRHIVSTAFLLCTCVPVMADSPRSAIPWLSESVTRQPQAALPDYPSLGQGTTVTPFRQDNIITTALDDPIKDGLGLLVPADTGFPQAIWGDISALRVRSLIQSQTPAGVPAAQALFRNLLLAETDPPLGSGLSNAVLLARIDALLAMGNLGEAQALIDRVGDGDPALFRRAFDIGLLTGKADAVCERLRGSPALSPTLPARVYCLAHGGDWNAAALTLKLGLEVGDITPAEEELLARFLDPAVFEGMANPPVPKPLTTLDFVLREAVALPRPAGKLPLAFLHADTDSSVALRQQVVALERLVRAGAIPEQQLFAAYRSGEPASTGGIWDHLDVVQKLDDALAIAEPDLIVTALTEADRIFSEIDLRLPFSRIYKRQLAALNPEEFQTESRNRIYALLLLADETEVAADWVPDNADIVNRFFKAFLTGATEFPSSDAISPLKAAVATGLTADAPPDENARLIAREFDTGSFGVGLLRTLDILSAGVEIDPGDLASGLYLLRHAGLDEAARRVALETLLLLPEA